MSGEGADPEGRGYPREREAQERASPVPSSFTMPSPSALFCLSNALRSRTLRERKERQGDVRRPLPFFLPEPCSAPQGKVESHGKPGMSGEEEEAETKSGQKLCSYEVMWGEDEICTH